MVARRARLTGLECEWTAWRVPESLPGQGSRTQGSHGPFGKRLRRYRKRGRGKCGRSPSAFGHGFAFTQAAKDRVTSGPAARIRRRAGYASSNGSSFVAAARTPRDACFRGRPVTQPERSRRTAQGRSRKFGQATSGHRKGSRCGAPGLTAAVRRTADALANRGSMRPVTA